MGKTIERSHLDWFLNLTATDQGLLTSGHNVLLDGGRIIGSNVVLLLDSRFDDSIRFVLEVPADCSFETRLADFLKWASGERFYYKDSNTTDQNFSAVSRRLIPGKKYQAEIWPIKRGNVLQPEDIISFYKKTGLLFVGAQGLSLAVELHKEKFPIGKRVLSYDEEENLWEDSDGDRRVPCFYLGCGGGSGWDLGRFWGVRFGGDCLFGLRDLCE